MLYLGLIFELYSFASLGVLKDPPKSADLS